MHCRSIPGPTQATLDTATRNLDVAKQTVAESEAVRDRARLAYGSTVDGVSKLCAISEHGLNYLRSRHPHALQRIELHRLGV